MEREERGCYKEDLSFSLRTCLMLQLFIVKTHRQQAPVEEFCSPLIVAT